MERARSLLRAAGIALGGVGLVGCLGAVITIRLVGNRLGDMNDRLFDGSVNAMAGVRRRIVQVQERVADAKITSAELHEAVVDWSRQKTAQRLAARLNVREKSEQVTSALRQADGWLEVASSSVTLVHDVLSLRSSTDPSGEKSSLDRLLDELALLRDRMAEVQTVAASVQARLAELSDDEQPGPRIADIARLTARVVATIGVLDSRLANLEDRASKAEDQLQDWRATVRFWIRAVMFGSILLFLWMAAGQVALCRLAWAGRPRRTDQCVAGAAKTSI